MVRMWPLVQKRMFFGARRAVLDTCPNLEFEFELTGVAHDFTLLASRRTIFTIPMVTKRIGGIDRAVDWLLRS